MDEDKTTAQSDEELEADGYYDDDMEDEELDLSFLDEEEADGGKAADGNAPDEAKAESK